MRFCRAENPARRPTSRCGFRDFLCAAQGAAGEIAKRTGVDFSDAVDVRRETGKEQVIRTRASRGRLNFEEIDAPLIVAFLDDLEKRRGISVRSRNLRLTAIHSFFRFAAFEAPAYSAQIQRVLAIPGKRYTRTWFRS
jgi:hypothetical protein